METSERLQDLWDGAQELIRKHRKSDGTVESYDLCVNRRFLPWCAFHGVDPADLSMCDEDAIAAYLVERLERPELFAEFGASGMPVQPTTLQAEIAAISDYYVERRLEDPTQGYPRQVLRGMIHAAQSASQPIAALTADVAESVIRLAPYERPHPLRGAVLVAHAAEAPLIQVLALERPSIQRDGNEFALALPESRIGRGGRRIAGRPARLQPASDPALCPVRTLAQLLDGPAGGERPLSYSGQSVGDAAGLARARVRRAATAAGLEVVLDPYPGPGISASALHRLLCFVDPRLLRFYEDQIYAVFGASGAFRADELQRCRLCDVDILPDGLVIYLDTAKGDQERKGSVVYIPRADIEGLCPVALFERWIALAGIREPEVLFPRIDGEAIDRLRGIDPQAGRRAIRRLAEALGLKGRWSTRSMRRGFCTSAAQAGETLARIAAAARHTRLETTRRYIEPASPVTRDAPRQLGL